MTITIFSTTYRLINISPYNFRILEGATTIVINVEEEKTYRVLYTKQFDDVTKENREDFIMKRIRRLYNIWIKITCK